MSKKKSQSSLEYLMTYGWALAAIFLVFGVIAYFGVLRPSNIMPESCIAEGSFLCSEVAAYRAIDGDFLQINLKNNVGLPIEVSKIWINEFSHPSNECIFDENSVIVVDSQGTESVLSSGNPARLEASQIAAFRFYCVDEGFTREDMMKLDFDVDYKVDRPGFFPKSSQVVATVQSLSGTGAPPPEFFSYANGHACTSDNQCIGDCVLGFCSGGGVGDGCDPDSFCDVGLSCDANVCTSPLPPFVNGESCADNSECISDYCDAGICEDPAPGPCIQDSECSAGYYCDIWHTNSCVDGDPGDGCGLDASCKTPACDTWTHTCSGGGFGDGCDEDADCFGNPSLECDPINMGCIFQVLGCDDDSDCVDPQEPFCVLSTGSCSNGDDGETCDDDGDCDSGNCNNNFCRNIDYCELDADCAPKVCDLLTNTCEFPTPTGNMLWNIGGCALANEALGEDGDFDTSLSCTFAGGGGGCVTWTFAKPGGITSAEIEIKSTNMNVASAVQCVDEANGVTIGIGSSSGGVETFTLVPECIASSQLIVHNCVSGNPGITMFLYDSAMHFT